MNHVNAHNNYDSYVRRKIQVLLYSDGETENIACGEGNWSELSLFSKWFHESST